MKALILTFAVLAICLTGCENNSKDETPVVVTESSYMFSGEGVVEFINWISHTDIDRTYVLVSGETLIISSETIIMVLRSSGSGYEAGSVSDVSPSNSVTYYYHQEDVDYSSDDERITPIEVWVK